MVGSAKRSATASLLFAALALRFGGSYSAPTSTGDGDGDGEQNEETRVEWYGDERGSAHQGAFYDITYEDYSRSASAEFCLFYK